MADPILTPELSNIIGQDLNAFKACVSFTVKPNFVGDTALGRQGMLVEWTVIKRDYQYMQTAVFVKIFRALAKDGIYELVDTVDWNKLKYIDSTGAPDNIYRLQIVDITGFESNLTNAKAALSPGTTKVYGYLVRVDGSPAAEVDVYFRVPRVPVGDSNKNLIARTSIKFTTGLDGYFEAELLSGIVADMHCDELGMIKQEFKVPVDKEYADIYDLI